MKSQFEIPLGGIASAILYIRVSTDEQAMKGYSLPVQEEKLRQFCITSNIQALKTIEEDYSAKTFNRPAWSNLMADLNRHKNQRPDFILFTRWDRFSRNAADAYYMIRVLENLGIEPQAIDQPLDLSVPENKLMLAMYTAIAEVENDRRGLNVKQSIRRARLEGRWTSHALLGYSNKLLENGQRGIIPTEPEAPLIKQAFNLIVSEGWRDVQSIYKQMVSLGLKCSRSHFWRILRNKAYCGMVKVPAREGEDTYWIKGLHEAIVPESLFRQVQQILDRKKRSPVVIGIPNEKLFLRGFLYCPKCGKRLTGSGSKGRRKRYYYYHCIPPCNFRIQADIVNQSFHKELAMLSINTDYLELYKEILKQTRKELFAEQTVTQKTLLGTINSSIERILHARELAEKGELTIDEYQAIKNEKRQQIRIIGLQLQRSVFVTKRNRKNLRRAVSQLSGISDFFSSSDLVTKLALLKLFFDNNGLTLTDDFHFRESFGFAMLSVFDLKVADCSCDIHDNPSLIKDERYGRKVLQKVMEIEHQKGSDLNKIRAQVIVGFLTDIASIITKKFS